MVVDNLEALCVAIERNESLLDCPCFFSANTPLTIMMIGNGQRVFCCLNKASQSKRRRKGAMTPKNSREPGTSTIDQGTRNNSSN